MGLRGALELYHCVPAAERYRVVRAFPCPTIKKSLDRIYGRGKWCLLWDLAVDRLDLPGAKEDPAMACLGATMLWEELDKARCVTRARSTLHGFSAQDQSCCLRRGQVLVRLPQLDQAAALRRLPHAPPG